MILAATYTSWLIKSAIQDNLFSAWLKKVGETFLIFFLKVFDRHDLNETFEVLIFLISAQTTFRAHL
jgi:hypothetical protein